MAYSDYGGYAYLNGVRATDRSDAVITDIVKSVPGMWPGFAFMAQGLSPNEAAKLKDENPNGHVVLGDGPLYVGLYKQSTVRVWLGGKEINLLPQGVDLPDGLVSREDWQGNPTEDASLDALGWAQKNHDRVPAEFAFPDGSTLSVVWTEQDNFYVYAKLAHPNGNVWAGWSGYGVGAGLEDCDYGYSTDERENDIRFIWPGAFAGKDAA